MEQRSLQPCGTWAAYKRHLKRGEDACDACKDAAALRSRVGAGRNDGRPIQRRGAYGYNCAACGQELDRRKRFCSPKCRQSAKPSNNCRISYCDGRRLAEGLCGPHLKEARWRVGILCQVETCEEPATHAGRCGTHYSQQWRASNPERVEVIRRRKIEDPEYRARERRRYYERRGLAAPAGAVSVALIRWDRRLSALNRLVSAAVGESTGRNIVSGPCVQCGDRFTVEASAAKYCSERCAKRAAWQRAYRRRGEFFISDVDRRAIYERDGWVCQLCEEPVDPELELNDVWAATLDHIVPRSHTLVPNNSPQNLQLAHRWCNSVKGDGRYYGESSLKVG